jgi:hypothetical protein
MTDVMIAMTVEEARLTLDEIREALDAGLDQLARAQRASAALEERGGHQSLGYGTITECLAVELGVTQRRGRQLMQQVRISGLLSEAAGEQVVVTAREAQTLSRASRFERKRVSADLAAGEPPAKVIREAVERVRTAGPKPAGKRSKYPPGQEGRVQRLAAQSRDFFDELADVDFAEHPVPPDYERIIDRLADGWCELRDRLIEAQKRPIRIDEWSA